MQDDSGGEGLSRRGFIKVAGAASAAIGAGALGLSGRSAAATAIVKGARAPLPRPKGPRLVVIGGGTSGLTIAKYAKREYPRFDVVLVEKRDMYASCFSSNLLYSGLVDLEFIADHSFLDAARNNDYLFLNATCTGLDRAKRNVHTTEGEIDYDYLVVAPGVSYDYSRIGISDATLIATLRTAHPAGFIAPMEHVTIREKVREFEGGIFVQTVPGGNYRCLPAPYERACMIAAWFKKNRIKGKVLVLDHNAGITIKANGFHAAFDELYRDYIEYKPSMQIVGVETDARVIRTEFESIPYDDASVYPGVRGSVLLEQLGLHDPRSPQKEAFIDLLHYNVPGDDRVYVAGDARPHPYSKSGNTANTEGKYIAKVLAARVQGKEIAWHTPETLCYSCVNAEPMESISVEGSYVYDPRTKMFSYSSETRSFEDRDQAKGKGSLEWARGIYRDLFA